MTFPGNANLVRVRGYWFAQSGGGYNGTITFVPQATILTDMGAFAYIGTETVSVTPDPTTGYFYADLLATDDPDLTAFAWKVTLSGQSPITIAVPYNSPVVDVGSGVMKSALWLVDAATITTPAPANTYYTSSQTDAAIATALSGISGSPMAPTVVKTSAYTAAVGDFVPVDTTSGAVPIALPAAPADKAWIGVKHVVQGGTNAVTITRGGSDVFNKTGGSTSLSLALLNQTVWLQYKASTAIWYVVAADTPLAQLDARYATPAYATGRAVALAVVLGS